ncbi:proteinase-activated receptor 1-like [Electrophorus electricus]|uniref:Proteinase-activated receptor 1 n=1 Tax=Electrophorus electricus TaxID=8005 RepID=A0A4W4FBP0_ELEEL|nr:proteinase-activated receptor 1-like [Electrophorus electricus]
MGINIILLFILIEHAITDSSNGSNPRGFALSRQTEAVTYEPIDYPPPDVESMQDHQGPNPGEGKGSMVLQGKWGRTSLHSLEWVFNSSNQTPARYNITVLRVSEHTALFLRGPLASYFIPTIYTLVFLSSVPLNAVAVMAFTCRIRRKKPAVVYMSQLALADLLFGLLLPLKVHYYAHGSDWPFGEAACRAVTAAFYSYMNCSVLLMMCMAVDRVLALALPVTSMHWRSHRNAALVCVVAWLLALAGATPLLTMQQTMQITQVGVTCHDVLEPQDPRYLQLFSSLACVFFLLPLAVTATCYSIVIRVLRPIKSLHGTSKWSSLSRKRKKAVAMAFAVAVEFVVCFAPTNVILLLHCAQQTAGESNLDGDRTYAAYILAVCLGSVSTCLDPLLYYYGSSQCRRQISSAMWWRRGKQATTTYHTHSGSTQSS